MRRYIVLLLITGIVWAQTDFDKLVLKDGTTYLGEYSKIEGEIIYFRIQGATGGFQPVPVKLIQTIELKDGFIVFSDNVRNNSSALEEYQILRIKEKAIYDAELAFKDWNLTIPYLLLNNKEKINFPKSILTDSEKEIYEQAYSKKLRERKISNAAVIIGCIIVVVIIAELVAVNFFPDGFYPRSSGGDYNGHTP
jgi:hypothetical protein